MHISKKFYNFQLKRAIIMIILLKVHRTEAPLPDFPISLRLSSNTLLVCGPTASLSLLNLLFPKLTIVSATSTFGSDNNFTVFMFAKFIGNLN
ncbi:hypothetical protein RAT170B_0683 [Rickettsia argasii T170-B]|uniref:Uncharacterized protein n=1 Tax=Rickettsia argasii T170-B TaxID=1268837 RepID=A0A0F3RFS6_9RICK|nr:hypothetical protein RAT170B_0683 [Rickettsia argasii T170-B]